LPLPKAERPVEEFVPFARAPPTGLRIRVTQPAHQLVGVAVIGPDDLGA
jgi:hypothetical protein